MNKKPKKTIILIVDDSIDDFIFLKEAFLANHYEGELIHCKNGKEALAEIKFKLEGESDLFILLDIDMPVMNGIELLKEREKSELLSTIPTIMYSSTQDPQHVLTCYRHGANSFMKKPETLDELQESIKNFIVFWLNSAILPPLNCRKVVD